MRCTSRRPHLLSLASLLLAVATIVFMPANTVQARSAGSSSSAGYSRPSTTSPNTTSSNTPARRPSVGSGGYALPTAATPAPASLSAPVSSGGDAAISRQNAGSALQTYRTQQAPPPAPPPAPTTTGSGTGYTQPIFVPSAPPQPSNGGFTEGVLLGTLLQSLHQPGRDRYFYDHQDDPAYRQWRAEADRTARTDAQMRTKLAELDARVTELQGQPRNPAAPPPAEAVPKPTRSLSIIWIILLLGAAIMILLFLWRRKQTHATASRLQPPLQGSKTMRFRLGQTIPLDPSPFILATGATKITSPEGGALISVAGIGLLQDGAVALNRLYMPGQSAFFQLHLAPDGTPDECRWFSQIDTITPTTPEEWGQWLNDAQGMIGWPQFQTKDGKLYNRAWAPGPTRIPPRDMTETRQTLDPAGKPITRDLKLQAMLYAMPTGLSAPAPQTEYILVCAYDDKAEAWIELHAGIDIAANTLTLPATPL